MQIRTRLALYFTIISAVLSLLILSALYLWYSEHTNADFFKALKERATVAGEVYLEEDEISASALQHLKERYLETLPGEIIRMYDSTDHPAFINGSKNNWSPSIINSVRQQRYLQYTQDNRKVVGIRYDDNQGVFVVLASAVDEAGRANKNNLLRIIVLLYLLQLTFLFFIGRWFAQKALAPVKKINKEVQRINATDLHLRVDEGNGKDEISELGKNFNHLLDRLNKAFELQKTFVANASHELRTPLTNIIGEIEVALSQKRSAPEWKEIALSVLSEANQLNETIDNFLNLGSMESSIALEKVSSIRIDELLWELYEEFIHKDPPLSLIINMVSLPQNEKDLCVQVNRSLLYLAIHNIIRNAFKFSLNKPVTIRLEYCDPVLNIYIEDKGIGIPCEEFPHLFQPFYRSSNAYAFEGKGMGLFIAKRIIDLYKGELHIQSVIGTGTTVNIAFAKEEVF